MLPATPSPENVAAVAGRAIPTACHRSRAQSCGPEKGREVGEEKDAGVVVLEPKGDATSKELLRASKLRLASLEEDTPKGRIERLKVSQDRF